jgi:hypothetical protein
VKLCIDFDGTIVDHIFPDIGQPVPGAFHWMKRFQQAGAKLILYTMRSDGQTNGPVLTQAVEFCRSRGIEFYGVNYCPGQGAWTKSPKVYGNLYIDDAAFGCPLRQNPRMGGEPYVDWDIVGPAVLKLVEEYQERHK